MRVSANPAIVPGCNSKWGGVKVTENEIVGYTVAYDRDEIQFPIYVVSIIGAALLAGAIFSGSLLMLFFGALATGVAFYNFPLIETGRPRLGAGQYGIFVEGLGLIQWRSIVEIERILAPQRGDLFTELRITIKPPMANALLLDWRKGSLLRRMMRLPWSMVRDDVIRITLDVFDKPPDEIHQTFLRMWRFYRTQ